jgi:hypothetical protein
MTRNYQEEIDSIKKEDIIWNCRFHPTNWYHEVGCPHMEWTKEQLQACIVSFKKFQVWNAKNIEFLLQPLNTIGEGNDFNRRIDENMASGKR